MAGYLGASPVPQTIQKKQSFTATASQTTFTTTGYTDGAFINVYLNGVRLINGTDYTATNGSDIVLTTGASASDVLDFETFNEFTLVDQTLETPTFRTSATLKNDTEEDTDGGRESTLIFKGEQSGGEISTLAEIEASHDGTADDEKGDLIFRTNDGSDGSSPTEAARIDSSQALLVGKTDTTNATTTVGHQLESSGRVYHVRDGGAALQVGRKTSDGNIAAFYRDGTSVGALSAKAYDMAIHSTASGHNGLRMHADGILPTDNTGAIIDADANLGISSHRFKDLYLSGGAYIGGTGASNKLEDYEEGSFTATIVGSTTAGSSPSVTGTYTKVGRSVTVTVDFSNVTVSGAAGDTRVNGLPFAASSGTGNAHHGACGTSNYGTDVLIGSVLNGGSNIRIRGANTTVFKPIINAANIYLLCTITYETA